MLRRIKGRSRRLVARCLARSADGKCGGMCFSVEAWLRMVATRAGSGSVSEYVAGGVWSRCSRPVRWDDRDATRRPAAPCAAARGIISGLGEECGPQKIVNRRC